MAEAERRKPGRSMILANLVKKTMEIFVVDQSVFLCFFFVLGCRYQLGRSPRLPLIQLHMFPYFVMSTSVHLFVSQYERGKMVNTILWSPQANSLTKQKLINWTQQ